MVPTPLSQHGPGPSGLGPRTGLRAVPTRDSPTEVDFYHHVLPAATPVLPQMVVSARVDGGMSGEQGCDWFETAVLPGGNVGIAIGDVIGTGLQSAAAVAQLRAVAAEALLAGCPPFEVLQRLERLAAHVTATHGSSALVAVVEPDGRLSLAHRGHAPPLGLSASGGARILPLDPSAPLGLGGRPASATAQLGPGEVLVVYSDGALPAWSPATGDGVEGLRQRCAEAAGSSLLVREGDEGGAWGLAGPRSPLFNRSDDRQDVITVVTVELRGAPSGLVAPVMPLDRPASRPGQLDEWLRELGASDEDVFAIHHAVAEVLRCLDEDNQLPQPAPRDGHRARLEASLASQGEVIVHVIPELNGTDDGELAGRVRSLDRARGLIAMLGLVGDAVVTLYGDSAGLMLRHALGRPVSFGPTQAADQLPEHHSLDVRALPRAAGVSTLAVRGDLDQTTVEDLRLAIAAAARSDERLVVDLNDVSALGGAGVTLLHDAVARGGTRLIARSGTPAATVMRMVALPFTDEG